MRALRVGSAISADELQAIAADLLGRADEFERALRSLSWLDTGHAIPRTMPAEVTEAAISTVRTRRDGIPRRLTRAEHG